MMTGQSMLACARRKTGRVFSAVIPLLMSVVLFAGCQRDETGLGTLADVTGQVLFEGQPTPGAVLTFFPEEGIDEDDPVGTTAIVDEEGRFSAFSMVSAGSKRGAPPGVYKIRISWKKPLDPDDRDSDMGPELLPEKYQDEKSSGLECEVVSGTNEIPPFELTR
jgi:hypothetical protein